ncbi:MAG TPA: hypothetical protein VMF89_29810, partial [Polyangiales bacterium]|nr:hypothetical protein [Polyangiales bacterium]
LRSWMDNDRRPGRRACLGVPQAASIQSARSVTAKLMRRACPFPQEYQAHDLLTFPSALRCGVDRSECGSRQVVS